jgi:hypothetical protein
VDLEVADPEPEIGLHQEKEEEGEALPRSPPFRTHLDVSSLLFLCATYTSGRREDEIPGRRLGGWREDLPMGPKSSFRTVLPLLFVSAADTEDFYNRSGDISVMPGGEVRGNFLREEGGQVSIEFVLLTGGVVLAAITVYTLRGTIGAFSTVVQNWVTQERDATLTRIAR